MVKFHEWSKLTDVSIDTGITQLYFIKTVLGILNTVHIGNVNLAGLSLGCIISLTGFLVKKNVLGVLSGT